MKKKTLTAILIAFVISYGSFVIGFSISGHWAGWFGAFAACVFIALFAGVACGDPADC